jgi:hypothetical protein
VLSLEIGADLFSLKPKSHEVGHSAALRLDKKIVATDFNSRNAHT